MLIGMLGCVFLIAAITLGISKICRLAILDWTLPVIMIDAGIVMVVIDHTFIVTTYNIIVICLVGGIS